MRNNRILETELEESIRNCHHEDKSALIGDNVSVSSAQFTFQVAKDSEAEEIK